MPEPYPITELRLLLITSQQEQLKISRSILVALKAHAEAIEASLRLTRRVTLLMAVLLAIVAGLNLYALWPSDMDVRRVIITEEPMPEEAPEPEGNQA